MNQIILYRKGAYQIYDPILRCAIFTAALTLKEVIDYLRKEHGAMIFKSLHESFDRAHKSGCSDGSDLFSTIVRNNNRLSPEQFVGRYLTL